MNEKMVKVEDYTPCRISECFLDKNNEIDVANLNGVDMFRLKGLGRIIWLMSDGNNTIRAIVDHLCSELKSTDREIIRDEVLQIFDAIRNKGAIVVNWNPIYKLKLCQELK